MMDIDTNKKVCAFLKLVHKVRHPPLLTQFNNVIFFIYHQYANSQIYILIQDLLVLHARLIYQLLIRLLSYVPQTPKIQYNQNVTYLHPLSSRPLPLFGRTWCHH